MSKMQKKLQDMRDGLEAVSTAIDAIAANKPEISGNVEFKADGGTVSNKGIVWSGEGNTRQLTMQQDRLFSSQSFDVNKNGDYRINNRSVLNSTHLGEGVRYSNLNSVGTLENLAVEGKLTVDNFIYYDDETMRLGVGHDAPSGALSIGSLEHEFVVDHNDVGSFSVGTWTTSDLSIITDNSPRIHISGAGNITLNKKVKVDGKLSVNLNNPQEDVDFSTAGPVRIEGKKFEVGTKSPTDGSWRLGDIIWNSNPQPSGYVGWICVREGTPGIWKPFAQIGS